MTCWLISKTSAAKRRDSIREQQQCDWGKAKMIEQTENIELVELTARIVSAARVRLPYMVGLGKCRPSLA